MAVGRGGYKVEGVKELRAALKKSGDNLEDFRSVNTQVSSYVGATAANMAPRRTGMLAASWRPGSAKANASVRFGGGQVAYANPIHWGTGSRPGQRGPHNIPASRFAVNAIDRTEPTWLPWYMTFIDEILQRNDLA